MLQHFDPRTHPLLLSRLMAKRTVETLICDLCPEEDEEPAVETVTVVTHTGAQFDNDVCTDHFEILRAGRRHTRANNGNGAGTTRTTQASAPRRKRISLPPIREWAAENNFVVADRGMVPKDVQDAYKAAQKG